ncbi:AAA family ATPase [Moraxella nasovis]|uniref:AAA family ATPase n=1 Tax=Moraxella nasovis TaxID=2904121 RepID=UPI001F61D8C0|nr:AAA family ATPase [Moraxella nasovis]UNU72871.1 AAA family ATPase [Moraxella nasovis]
MKQATALEILKTGQNVFLTGQAGAGKTYVLNQYIHYLRARGIAVAITASTGIAATHMNGMTLHAWSGMGIKDAFSPDDYSRLKSRQMVVERIKQSKVLIVDEISMLHAKQVDLLNEILQKIRDNDAAFGGIQVIFSGDFFQLPPVGKRGETNKEKFAFMAKAWLDANFQVCYLTEQHRQTACDEHQRFGISLNDILNQIRRQDVSQTAIYALNTAQNHAIDDDCTRLYTHNANVDEINKAQLNKLTTKAHTFTATEFGDKALLENLRKNVRAAAELELKVGAKVMFVKNNPDLNVSNGTMGEVVDFATLGETDESEHNLLSKYPVVRLHNGRTVIAEPDDWTIENPQGEVLASYTQIPLCLAWAITIHKSQGMTLDAAKIDLSRTFEMGQGYVALSRLRSLDGLKLLGFNQKSLLLDEWVFRVDRRLQELAHEHEMAFYSLDDDVIKQVQDAFVVASDGITKKDVVIANEKRLLEQKHNNEKRAQIAACANPNKKAVGQTLQETKKLIESGLSILDVAQKRTLAISTIIGHIKDLREQDKDFNCSHIRPSDKTLQDVQKAYDALEAAGEFADKITLKPIVDELGGDYDYNTVRLALIFIDTKDKVDGC